MIIDLISDSYLVTTITRFSFSRKQINRMCKSVFSYARVTLTLTLTLTLTSRP